MRQWRGRSRKSRPGDRASGPGADPDLQDMWPLFMRVVSCRRATYARAATQTPAADFGCAFGRGIVRCRVPGLARLAISRFDGISDGSCDSPWPTDPACHLCCEIPTRSLQAAVPDFIHLNDAQRSAEGPWQLACRHWTHTQWACVRGGKLHSAGTQSNFAPHLSVMSIDSKKMTAAISLPRRELIAVCRPPTSFKLRRPPLAKGRVARRCRRRTPARS
jgi:hypothetical protein